MTMRLLTVYTIFLLTACGARAQVGFGGEAGMGVATMKFAPSLSPIHYTTGTANPVASGRIGGLIDVPLNQHFTFQTGVYLVRKGAVRYFSYHQDDSFHEEVHQALLLSYLELPVLLLWKSGMQGKGRMVLGIGPAVAYLAGGSNKLEDNVVFAGVSNNTSGTYRVQRGSTVTGFDIGVHLLAGYELPTGLFFRVSYTDGGRDIGLGTEIDKNRTWCLTAGYITGRGRNINKETEDLIDHSGADERKAGSGR